MLIVKYLDIIFFSSHNHDMRKKVSTLVDEGLFRRVKLEAARQGKQISGIVGEALEQYLGGKGGRHATSGFVTESWGALYLPQAEVHEIMEEEDELLDS